MVMVLILFSRLQQKLKAVSDLESQLQKLTSELTAVKDESEAQRKKNEVSAHVLFASSTLWCGYVKRVRPVNWLWFLRVC